MANAYHALMLLITSLFNALLNLATASEKVTKVADQTADNFLKEETAKAKIKELELDDKYKEALKTSKAKSTK